jgi:RimJ/RimL family protein N-acetyltransferase
LKGDEVVKTDAKVFSAMPGSVIPARFWNSADDFLSRGKGFSLLHNGEIASTAYSAYVLEDKLEIGIETVEKYRGMGFAFIVCKRLIDYCIESDLTPVWSCRHENTGSYNLALKLGFEPVLYRPFYRLSI